MAQPIKFPEEPFEKIIARIARVPSLRVETREFVYHRDPRISANKLGEFLITDECRKRTILKSSKKAKKAIVLHYSKTRIAFAQAFSSIGIDPKKLKSSAQHILASESTSKWEKEDNIRSANALELVAKITGKFQLKDAERIPRPEKGWNALQVNGVRVSVNPDIVFSLPHRGTTKVGAALLYTTKDETKSLGRCLGTNSAGDYVSTLLLMLLEARLANIGIPYPSACYVIDVHRGDVYTPPTRFKTLLKHIEAACEGIASRWDDIEV